MLASKVLHRLTTAATGTICTQTFQDPFLQDTKTDLENVVHDDHTSEQYLCSSVGVRVYVTIESAFERDSSDIPCSNS